MATIFQVTTPLKKQVRLTERQWEHLKSQHPELAQQQDKIRQTLEQPEFVVQSIKDAVYHYVRHYAATPVTDKYLLAVVKHINAEGFVITAFFVSRIRKKGKVAIYGQEAFDQL